MFYVTENELRGAYNREHFSNYTLPEDAKLTPSARQFLIDFHIDFNEGYGAACGNADTSVHDPAAAAARAEDALASFYDDIAVLGARLRMLGRNALGIENDSPMCATRWEPCGKTTPTWAVSFPNAKPQARLWQCPCSRRSPRRCTRSTTRWRCSMPSLLARSAFGRRLQAR